MLTFAIGVLSRQWNIAAMGIVYSYLTAAAIYGENEEKDRLRRFHPSLRVGRFILEPLR
jgi:hypothetical protein